MIMYLATKNIGKAPEEVTEEALNEFTKVTLKERRSILLTSNIKKIRG